MIQVSENFLSLDLQRVESNVLQSTFQLHLESAPPSHLPPLNLVFSHFPARLRAILLCAFPGTHTVAQAGLELADTRRLRLPGAGMGGVVYAPGSRRQTHTPWPATYREILPSATSRRRSRGCPPRSLWWKSLDSGVRRRQHTTGRGGLTGACPWLRAGAVSVRGSYFLHLSPSGADAVLAAARMRGCPRAAAPWTTRRRRTGSGRSARPSCRRVARGAADAGRLSSPAPCRSSRGAGLVLRLPPPAPGSGWRRGGRAPSPVPGASPAAAALTPGLVPGRHGGENTRIQNKAALAPRAGGGGSRVSVRSEPTRTSQWVPGRPGLCSQALSQETKINKG